MTKAGSLAADFEAFKKKVEERLSALENAISENPKKEAKKENKKTKKDDNIVLGTKDDDIFVFEE